MADDDLRVDVGVLKTQVLTLSSICSKLDQVIEKLVDQHDRHIAKVYTDMDNRRLETDADVKEIHDRIDTVLDKLQDSERRIMDEMKSLKKCLNDHSESSRVQLDRINQWKWSIAGGILVLSWLISHSNFDTILKSIH
jgi:DNA-directed RNA polymerase sigma subunit (sigma70/sigma32)